MGNLIARELDVSGVQKLDLLDTKGQLKLLSANEYDALDRTSVRYWCNRNARYGLPTKELVAWLKEYIGGRKAIEIGAGAADLAYHLGITATDSKIQAEPEVKALYMSMMQPVIQYPEWVEKIDAVSAVREHKPEVVVAQWVTHWIDPNLPPPPGGGCIYGIKEEEILAAGVTYIMIGNEAVHQYKPILKLPHKKYNFKFIRSRATYPDKDVVYVWN